MVLLYYMLLVHPYNCILQSTFFANLACCLSGFFFFTYTQKYDAAQPMLQTIATVLSTGINCLCIVLWNHAVFGKHMHAVTVIYIYSEDANRLYVAIIMRTDMIYPLVAIVVILWLIADKHSHCSMKVLKLLAATY